MSVNFLKLYAVNSVFKHIFARGGQGWDGVWFRTFIRTSVKSKYVQIHSKCGFAWIQEPDFVISRQAPEFHSIKMGEENSMSVLYRGSGQTFTLTLSPL